VSGGLESGKEEIGEGAPQDGSRPNLRVARERRRWPGLYNSMNIVQTHEHGLNSVGNGVRCLREATVGWESGPEAPFPFPRTANVVTEMPGVRALVTMVRARERRSPGNAARQGSAAGGPARIRFPGRVCKHLYTERSAMERA